MYTSVQEALEHVPGQLVRVVLAPGLTGRSSAAVAVRYDGAVYQVEASGDSALAAVSTAVDALREQLGVGDGPRAE